jgi:hypothetical protein
MANFAQTIAKMPKGQAFGVCFAGAFAISGLILGFYGSKGKEIVLLWQNFSTF